MFRLFLLAVAVSSGAGALGLLILGPTSSSPAKLEAAGQRPEHRLTISSLNFGETWETTSFPWQVQLRNDGTEEVAASLAASCRCTSVSPAQLVLAPGEQQNVNLAFDLTSGDQRSAERQFGVQLTARDNSTGRIINTWPLRGTVKAVLAVSPPTLSLIGNNCLHQGGDGTLPHLEIRALRPINRLEAEVSPPELSVSIAKRSDGLWDACFAPMSTADRRLIAATLRITPYTTTEEAMPPHNIRVQIEVGSKYRVSPQTVVVRGAQAAEFTLFGAGGETFEVVTVQGAGASVSQIEGSGESALVKFRVTVDTEADYAKKREVTVKLRSPTGDQDEAVTIPVFALRAGDR